MFGWIYCLTYYSIWLVGIYTLIHSCICLSAVLVRNFIRKELDLPKRYGAKSWALVTGATGGIGEAFCIQFAKRQFNVIVVGRNKQKLEDLESQLKKVNKEVKVKIVVADFGESMEPQFYQDIYEQVKDLDISILVNNAGAGTVGFFELTDAKEHLNNIRINAGAPAMLTHSLINKLLNRTERSAIINVSSVGNNSPLPYFGVYPATKRFLSFFSYSLHDNYKSKIDVQNLTPGWVTTKIGKTYILSLSYFFYS